MSMSTLSPALSPATLSYSSQCQQVLLRDDSLPSGGLVPRRPCPRFTNKLFAPQPAVDDPDSMCALVDNCCPSFLMPATSGTRRRHAGRPSVTAKHNGVFEPPRARVAVPPNSRSSAPGQDGTSSSSVAELSRRLGEAEYLVATGGTHPHTQPTRPAGRASAADGRRGAAAVDKADSAAAAPAAGRGVTATNAARHRARALAAERTLSWVKEQETSCQLASPSRPLSASPTSHRQGSRTPMALLLRNRFVPPVTPTLPYFSLRGRPASASAASGPVSLRGLTPTASDLRPCTPAFLTDELHSVSGVRPTSAPTPQEDPLRVPLAAQQDCSTWLDSVLRQPIQSYKVVQTIAEPAAPPPRFTGQGEPASVARQHLVYAQQRFEHERVFKQNELQLFLEYRSRCRSVVAYKMAEGGTTVRTRQLAGDAQDRDDGELLDTKVAAAVRDALVPQFQQEQDHRTADRAQHGEPSLRSVWTEKASDMALSAHKLRVCDALRAFQVDFPAAALSIEAMEQLRADIVERILRPSKKHRDRLMTTSDLSRFLTSRCGVSASRLQDRSTVTAEDMADAMPSQAEAAFVRHAFSVLQQAPSLS